MLQIPNRLKIKQKIELLEIFFDFESSNRYEIFEANGQRFLFAYETCGFLWKWLFPRQRPFEIHLVDERKNEHFNLKRNFYFFFPSYELHSEGELIGRIKKNFGFFHTKYSIYDSDNVKIAKLRGPFWRPWTFEIFDAQSGKKVGLIGKKLSGLKEFFTDSDNFSFEVDDSLSDDEEFKALILACTFAVDYDNFDKPADHKKGN